MVPNVITVQALLIVAVIVGNDCREVGRGQREPAGLCGLWVQPRTGCVCGLGTDCQAFSGCVCIITEHVSVKWCTMIYFGSVGECFAWINLNQYPQRTGVAGSKKYKPGLGPVQLPVDL